MKYYKILNEMETHGGLKYKTGLNINIEPFNPSGDCTPGGIYFASIDILAFLHYGVYARLVTLPNKEYIYMNPGSPQKFKAHRVILGERFLITPKVIQRWIREGADVHANYDAALWWASEKGHLEITKVLLDNGANIHTNDDCPLRWASKNGHTKIVELLLKNGADISADSNYALECAAVCGHLDTVKLLLDYGADVRANNDISIKGAYLKGHTDVVNLLIKRGAKWRPSNKS